MTVSSRMISERAVGQYPLSIATSLAIESATGIHPEIPVTVAPITEYTELWVNLRTLFRNLLGALEGDGAKTVIPEAVSDEMRQEMDRIDRIVADLNPGCTVRYYVSNYHNLAQKYPHARVRVDSTDNQKHHTKIMTLALKELLLMEHGSVQNPGQRVQVFELKLQPRTQVRTLILTHYPFDLCSAKHFGSLDLLESHTGKIKQRSQWNTKYHNGKDLTMIPFREDMLQIFGDTESFHPFPIEQRRELLDLAQQYTWTVLTTKDYILHCLDHLKNKYFVAKLRTMLV